MNIMKIYEFTVNAIGKLIEQVITFTPALLTAFLLLLAGFLLAKLFGWISRKITARLGVDNLIDKAGLGDSLKSARISALPSHLIGRLIFWIIMLTFIMAAFDSLGIEAVTESFQKLIAYIPNLLVAVVIAVIGLFVAQTARSTTSVALNRMGIEFQEQIAAFVYYAILVVTAFSVLRQLQIEIAAFESVIFLLTIAVVILGGGLLAWGAHRSVEAIIAGFYIRKMIQESDEISTPDGKGRVELIGSTHTELQSGGQRVFIPNTSLAKSVITVKSKG